MKVIITWIIITLLFSIWNLKLNNNLQIKITLNYFWYFLKIMSLKKKITTTTKVYFGTNLPFGYVGDRKHISLITSQSVLFKRKTFTVAQFRLVAATAALLCAAVQIKEKWKKNTNNANLQTLAGWQVWQQKGGEHCARKNKRVRMGDLAFGRQQVVGRQASWQADTLSNFIVFEVKCCSTVARWHASTHTHICIDSHTHTYLYMYAFMFVTCFIVYSRLHVHMYVCVVCTSSAAICMHRKYIIFLVPILMRI